MKSTELYWLAGLLEGEGCFTPIRESRRGVIIPRIQLCMNDKDVIFMLMDDKEVHPTYDTGIWIKSPFFASALNNLFDTAWKGMKK